MELIEVNINIYGLPLHKSSTSQIYPILCNLVNNFSEVNIIGIYHGFEKPSDANLFLKPFIEEARNLTINGLTGTLILLKSDCLYATSRQSHLLRTQKIIRIIMHVLNVLLEANIIGIE